MTQLINSRQEYRKDQTILSEQQEGGRTATQVSHTRREAPLTPGMLRIIFIVPDGWTRQTEGEGERERKGEGRGGGHATASEGGC